MPGDFSSMRTLPPHLHEAATKLVAEAMASATLRVLQDPEGVQAMLREADPTAPVTASFHDVASDFLDLRGDLVEWALPVYPTAG